jgi:hypothetical protein
MSHVMKAASTSDLLVVVPHLLGYRPRNSIVFVTFRGKRSCGAMRVDLPTVDSERVQRRLVTTMVGMLCKIPGVDAILPVLFTDAGFDGASEPPHSRLADIINRRIELSGFELRQSLCLAGDGWASYLDDDIPAGGRPLAELETSTVADSVPEHLRTELGIVDPHAELLPEATDHEREDMAADFEWLRMLMESQPDDDDEIPRDLLPLADLPSFAEDMLAGGPTPDDLALLAFAAQGPPVRDHVMLQWATNEATGIRLWGAPGEECADIMLGHGPRPDLDRMVRGIEILRTLASRVSGRQRLPLLCMLGWLNWALGRGSLAARYVEAAAAIDPEYGMAEVLGTLLHSGMQPEWMFERDGNA